MDVEGSAANAAGVTSQEYLTRYRGSLSRGEMYRGAEARFPLYAERIRVARRRGQPRRRTRADVSGPRPRPQAVVTSRSPRPSGRGAGGSWEKTATRSAPTTAWGRQNAGAVRPPRRTCPHLWGPGGGMPPCGGGAEADAGGGPALPVGNRGRGPRLPCPAPCGRGRRRAARAWIARLVRATIRIKGGPLARRAAYLRCPAAAFGGKGQ